MTLDPGRDIHEHAATADARGSGETRTGDLRRRRCLVVGNVSGAHHGAKAMADRLLAALLRLGVDVTTLDTTFSGAVSEVARVRPAKAWKGAVLAVRASWLASRRRFDLAIHLPTATTMGCAVHYPLQRLLHRCAKSWIAYPHGVGYTAIAAQPSFAQRLQPAYWARMARVIAPSQAVAEDLVGGGVVRDRIVVTPNCLAPGWRLANEDDARSRASDPPQKILYVSTVATVKGIWDLIGAYEQLVREAPDAPPLEIAGAECEDASAALLLARADSAGIRGKVRLLGPVTPERVEALLAAPSIFVFPSRLPEAFGLVLIEAMSKGVPAVGTESGAIPEVLDGGAAGVLVPPASPEGLARGILSLLGNADLRVNMALAGLRRVDQEYVFDRYVQRIGAVVRGVLAAPSA